MSRRLLIGWVLAGVPLSLAIVTLAVMMMAGPRLDPAVGMATTVFLGMIVFSGAAGCFMLLRGHGPWRFVGACAYFAAMYLAGGTLVVLVACSFGPCH